MLLTCGSLTVEEECTHRCTDTIIRVSCCRGADLPSSFVLLCCSVLCASRLVVLFITSSSSPSFLPFHHTFPRAKQSQQTQSCYSATAGVSALPCLLCKTAIASAEAGGRQQHHRRLLFSFLSLLLLLQSFGCLGDLASPLCFVLSSPSSLGRVVVVVLSLVLLVPCTFLPFLHHHRPPEVYLFTRRSSSSFC